MTDLPKTMEHSRGHTINRQQTEIYELRRQRDKLQLESNVGLEAKRKARRECAQLKTRLTTYRTRLERLEKACQRWKANAGAAVGSNKSIRSDNKALAARANDALEECVQWKAMARALETRYKKLETCCNELGAGTLFMGDGDAFIEIMTERKKQRVKWSADHDDGHILGELAIAAAQLAVEGTDESVTCRSHEEDMWGLVHHTEDDRRRLVIAAALLVAEIGRERRRSERYRKSREALVERTVSSSETGIFEGDELAAALVEEHVKAHTNKDSETIGIVVDKSGATELTETGIVAPAEAKEIQAKRDQREDIERATGHIPPVKIKKIHPELGKSISMPARKSEYAAGYDVCAAIDKPFDIRGGEGAMIELGFALEIPPGYEGQIRPRSGLAKKSGITVLNSPGTIDADYRGEVCVMLVNHREPDCSATIEPGDRIAQIVFAAVETPELVVVDELSETERGDGGFGSTDKEP